MSCAVCNGTGLLLQDVCPMCDGKDPLQDSDVKELQLPSCAMDGDDDEDGDDVSPMSLDKYTSTRPPTQAQSEILARGLSLAGSALEAPRFHTLCHQWRIGQCFESSDDPDRTEELWQSPPFAFGNASEQREKTSAEDLPLPAFARMVHGVLDPEHCAALIGLCNAKGFTPALLNVGCGRQKLAPSCRDGFRVIADDDALAAYLFEVLRPHIPERLEEADAVGLNRRCRFLCYTPGQEFPEHCDGRYNDPSGAFSKVTVQLYLHDVPPENGGATTFLFRDGCGSECRLPCQPRAGSVLLFSQVLSHEGSQLKSGLKYTVRSEVMYSRSARGQIPRESRQSKSNEFQKRLAKRAR